MLLISKKGDYNLRRKKGGGERERERGGGYRYIQMYKMVTIQPCQTHRVLRHMAQERFLLQSRKAYQMR